MHNHNTVSILATSCASHIVTWLILIKLIWFRHNHTNRRFFSPFPPLVEWTASFTSTYDDCSNDSSDYAKYENNHASSISKQCSVNILDVEILEEGIDIWESNSRTRFRAAGWRFITAIFAFINAIAVK